jgi:RNA polymerase sigma-70 factor (ECF subfamily)
MTADERELLAAWGTGDASAANELVDRYIGLVHAFLRDKVEPGVLDDLVQRTFLAALERRTTLRDGAKFGQWLVGIARNLLLMHWREVATARRLRRRFEDLTVDELLVTPSQVVARREEQRLLLRALRRIPIELQLLLELFYWEGFGHAELVELLDVPLGTIKSRLNRARELLFDALRALGASDDITASTSLQLDAWVRSLGRGSAA